MQIEIATKPEKSSTPVELRNVNSVTSLPSNRLLFVRLLLVVDDGEVSQLVSVLVAGDHVEVVAQLLLLQVLLGEVLEVALRERSLGCHGDARLPKVGCGWVGQ